VSLDLTSTDEHAVERSDRRRSLEERIGRRYGRKYVRFVVAALGGIPWIGSLLGATASLEGESEQADVNELQRLWIEEHQAKLELLARTLAGMIQRFDGLGDEIDGRVQSEEYLALIRRGFRTWDQADTDEKRDFVRKLLTNAGAYRLCSDDLVRLFLSWIEAYHEAHFVVIREIYQRPRSTRAEIWANIHGEHVREDSAEADLFKLLVRDLSMGSVLRQERATDASGNFLRVPAQKNRGHASPYMKSAFDNSERYVLTELGGQFVHYVMDELVPRVSAGNPTEGSPS
jgi:hypothetical protein